MGGDAGGASYDICLNGADVVFNGADVVPDARKARNG